MARDRRIEIANGIYQVTQHATGDELFFRDAFDRFLFEGLLGRTVDRFCWDLHAYCQVGNHYHLLLRLTEPTLALGMQFLDSRYVQGFNQRHERKGALARARYTSTLVADDAHYIRCLIYIAMNPVKAGLCRRPEDWEWGSYGGRGTLARTPDKLLRDFIDVSLA
jgi:REP element-mobilizing transposase RayT